MSKIDSIDQSFLDRLYKTIEDNLVNEQFGVAELAHEIGVSRSQLHRRLHALNGQSASQLIREYRLKKAKEMLENEAATVAEISYLVGFGSPSYFNTCFHDYFGYAPGEFKIRKSIEKKKKPFTYQKAVLIFLSILALIAVSYYLLNRTGIISNEIVKSSIPDNIIAVLPFGNAHFDSTSIHFEKGMMEDSASAFIGGMISEGIRKNLATYSEIRILQETSSVQLAGMSIGEARKNEIATHLIQGNYRKEGSEIVVNAEIIEVSSGNLKELIIQKATLDQIPAAISTISNQVVSELNIKVEADSGDHLYQFPTKNKKAYLLYEQGKYLCKRSGRDDINMAITFFSDAIKIDSKFAEAYASRANAYILSASWWGDKNSSNTLLLALNDIDSALSLDSVLWEAYEARGEIKYTFQWDYNAAEPNFLKAVELNKNGRSGLYAAFLWQTGQYHKAIQMHQINLLNDPLNVGTYADFGLTYFIANRKEEAFKMYEQAFMIDPNNFALHVIMAQFLMLENQYEEAMEYARNAAKLDPGLAPFDVPLQGMIYARMGDRENTLKIMNKMDEFELKGLKGWWGYSWAKFLMYSFLGDKEPAMQSLQESINKREVIVVVTNAWLHFYDLDAFKDEAYYAIMEEAGLYYDKYEG